MCKIRGRWVSKVLAGGESGPLGKGIQGVKLCKEGD